jgi:hypothetical protein
MFSLCKSIIVKCYGMCDYSSNEICFTLYFKCVLIVLKCMWLYWPVFIIKRAYRILQERVKPLGSLKRYTTNWYQSNWYTTNWYQSQGFDTEPRWASGAVFGPKM